MAGSRSRKGIVNTAVALAIYAVNILLQFISRKVFIDQLGTEVLGLNTTAMSILQFLNLAELGIGTAVICTLYKPLSVNDNRTTAEILSVQGWMYRRVAYLIIALSAVVMVFFPLIFAKMELPLWYAYASFGVLLFSSLLSYFVNYREAVLCADQAEYKLQLSFKTVMLIKVLAQILAVSYLSNGYVYWLIFEAFFAVLASLSLNRTIYKSYPYLREKIECTSELRSKYQDVILKIKQVFVHKIGAYAINESTPLIIFGFADLSLVAIYGNYMLIFNGLARLLFSLFNSLGAGVGNLIAEGDRDHILKVFKELFCVRIFCVSLFCVVSYFVTEPFMDIWFGKGYLLSRSSLLLLILIFYLNQMRTITDIFLYGYGLFKDVWAPLVESAVNISLAVLFGYIWGLNGILAAVAISVFVIHFIWKPYFLFRDGLKMNIWPYVFFYAKNIILVAIAVLITALGVHYFSFNPSESMYSLILFAFAVAAAYSFLLVILQVSFEPSFRHFIRRFV